MARLNRPKLKNIVILCMAVLFGVAGGAAIQDAMIERPATPTACFAAYGEGRCAGGEASLIEPAKPRSINPAGEA